MYENDLSFVINKEMTRQTYIQVTQVTGELQVKWNRDVSMRIHKINKGT